MGGTPQAQPPAQMDVPPDMGCAEVPRAALWTQTKAAFRGVFGITGVPPFEVAKKEAITPMLDGVMASLKAQDALSPQSQDECGFGKFSLQLISVLNVDDPAALSEMIRGVEQLS